MEWLRSYGILIVGFSWLDMGLLLLYCSAILLVGWLVVGLAPCGSIENRFFGWRERLSLWTC